jgi:hypothetical protein
MPPISSFFGRRLVKNPFFLFAGTLLFDEKIRHSASQPVKIRQNHSPNIKCFVPVFFGDQFVEKDGGIFVFSGSEL